MEYEQTADARSGLRLTVISAALAAAFALPGAVGAFEINTGNEDIQLRWDNTVRLNIVERIEAQDEAILRNPNFDDGDRNFDRGRVFTRIDWLTEFDVIWKRQLGFRVSAAGWWDPPYDRLNNSSTQTSNHLVFGRPALGLPAYTKRYAEGASGEFLDVFGFGKFDIGDIPVNVKLGQTTVFWGESLLFNGAIHSIAYSQNPIDVWKGVATPGAESKELFRPRVGLNVQAQVAQDLSVMAQYFFNWQRFSNQAFRYPESGSYLSIGDALLWGGESQITNATGTQRVWRGTDITPEENTGNWGLGAKWSPDWLDGTLGGYYRRTYDMQPQAMATPAVVPGVPAAACTPRGGVPLPGNLCFVNPQAASLQEVLTLGKVGLYNAAFGSDIDIFGVSLSKNIAGVSIGAELSYRRNMPLNSDPVQVLPAAFVPLLPGSIATTALPEGDTPGAKGSTMHGLVNALGIINKTPVFDTAVWNAELTWMTWLDVSQNEAVFKGRDNYTQIDRVSKNYFGLALNFTPTWFQVFPGVDLLMPLSWSQGISGNSAINAGGQKNAGSFGIGVAADIYQKYRIDLKYVGFYGDYSTCPRTPANVATCVTGAADIFNGLNATISDRDFIALTFKTTF